MTERASTAIFILNQTDARIQSLQWLRALAALGVVLYHLDMGVNVYRNGRAETTVFGAGGLGVILFFVLSGFVIALSAAARPRRRLAFVIGRLARLYPAYLATAALVMLALALAPRAALNHAPEISWQRLLRTLVFDFGQMGGFVYVGWTLFYELGFYLAFAALVPRFGLLRQRLWFQGAVAALLLLCAATDAARIGSFVLGVVVFLLLDDQARRVKPAFTLLTLSLAVLLFGLRCPEALGCAALVAGLVLLERQARVSFNWAPLLRLGEASYSIYLVQVLSNSAALKLAQRISGGGPGFGPLALVLGLAAAIAGGLLMHRWLERPGTALTLRWGERWLLGAPAGRG